MKDSGISMNPNELVQFLNKPSQDFTRKDIMRFCEERQIKMLNFRYVAEDGRLKTLNFVINSRDYLETILTRGERVDGSSLFSFIESGSSDLYVVPRYRTAFVNPFAEVPTLDIFCSFTTTKAGLSKAIRIRFYTEPINCLPKKPAVALWHWASWNIM